MFTGSNPIGWDFFIVFSTTHHSVQILLKFSKSQEASIEQEIQVLKCCIIIILISLHKKYGLAKSLIASASTLWNNRISLIFCFRCWRYKIWVVCLGTSYMCIIYDTIICTSVPCFIEKVKQSSYNLAVNVQLLQHFVLCLSTVQCLIVILISCFSLWNSFWWLHGGVVRVAELKPLNLPQMECIVGSSPATD